MVSKLLRSPGRSEARLEFLNALSIDVEDYFMVSAFEPFVKKDQWDGFESRVVANTKKILRRMEQHKTKGTFFVVGWVAARFPLLVKEISNAGHEIACHSYYHKLVYNQSRSEFREDLHRTKSTLEDATGKPVIGYRAPSFSLIKETQWVFDELLEEGFKYDASILPAPHARGGLLGADRFPHRLGELAEFPMSTVKIFGRTVPFSGGGYFRLFPYSLFKRAARRVMSEGRPFIVYLHPWEFDADQPRMNVKGMDRFKHYVNLHQTENKFTRLLKDFSFGRVDDVLQQQLGVDWSEFRPAEARVALNR